MGNIEYHCELCIGYPMAPEALPDEPEVVSYITHEAQRSHGLAYTCTAV